MCKVRYERISEVHLAGVVEEIMGRHGRFDCNRDVELSIVWDAQGNLAVDSNQSDNRRDGIVKVTHEIRAYFQGENFLKFSYLIDCTDEELARRFPDDMKERLDAALPSDTKVYESNKLSKAIGAFLEAFVENRDHLEATAEYRVLKTADPIRIAIDDKLQLAA